jgi:uncharacterized membrane protein YkvA (DUF1232 family)
MLIEQVMLTWRLIRDPRVSLLSKAIPVLAVAYVLSPFDIIPDFLIGLGQLDDLGIIIGAMRLFESVTPEYIVLEHREEIARRNLPEPRDIISIARDRIFGPGSEKSKRK